MNPDGFIYRRGTVSISKIRIDRIFGDGPEKDLSAFPVGSSGVYPWVEDSHEYYSSVGCEGIDLWRRERIS